MRRCGHHAPNEHRWSAWAEANRGAKGALISPPDRIQTDGYERANALPCSFPFRQACHAAAANSASITQPALAGLRCRFLTPPSPPRRPGATAEGFRGYRQRDRVRSSNPFRPLRPPLPCTHRSPLAAVERPNVAPSIGKWTGCISPGGPVVRQPRGRSLTCWAASKAGNGVASVGDGLGNTVRSQEPTAKQSAASSRNAANDSRAPPVLLGEIFSGSRTPAQAAVLRTLKGPKSLGAPTLASGDACFVGSAAGPFGCRLH
jgi:hypothetical protein